MTPACATLFLLLSALLASAADPFRVERNIDYLGPARTEKADLYLPNALPEGTRAPAVVIIHGGGWTGGGKANPREINIGTNLALNGYMAMSIDYVLARTNGTNIVWPQNLHDCKTAVRWLRANAGRLRLNPDRIGAIGGSAGGHLAAMLAVAGPESNLDPPGPHGEFPSRVQCAVDLYGPADLVNWKDIAAWRKTHKNDPELYRISSPTTWVDRNDPPLLILHGTADRTVPVDQSERFAAALKQAGVEHELVIIPDAPHSFHLQPRQRDLRPLVLGFFDRHLKR